MKYSVLILLLLFNTNLLFSQNNGGIDKTIKTYNASIDAGNKALKAKKFNDAINYFFAAEAYDPKKRKEVKGLIDDVFIAIQAVKDAAIASQIIAEKALETASKERKKAEQKEKEANLARMEADVAKADAEREKDTANSATIVAQKATETAQKATETAQKATETAQKATKTAEDQRNKAVQLQVEALSTATALKSLSIEDEKLNRLKALLATESYNMQMTMLLDATKEAKTWIAPTVYSSLYTSLSSLEDEYFDEVPTSIGHSGPVRAIIQTDTNLVYTSGSDGKLILWDIKTWKKNGKPDGNLTLLREKESIDITMSVHKGKNNDNQIAIGGRFSPVETITYQDLKIKKIQKKSKNEKSKQVSLTVKKLKKYGLEEVHQLSYLGDKLYALRKDGYFIAYDIEKDIVEEIKLSEEVRHFDFHPKDNLVAISQKNEVLLLDLTDLKKTAVILDLAKGKMGAQDISAIEFNKTNGFLAVGTRDGYIGLIPQLNGVYGTEQIKSRQYHSLLVSDIDFKTYNTDTSTLDIMVVGNYDGKVSIWVTNELENDFYEPFLLDDNSTWVTSLSFVDSEYNQLMVGYFDGTVKFWNLDIMSLANALKCKISSKYPETNVMTKEEKIEFYLNTKIPFGEYAKCEE